mgnify:CR=1 FL=1
MEGSTSNSTAGQSGQSGQSGEGNSVSSEGQSTVATGTSTDTVSASSDQNTRVGENEGKDLNKESLRTQFRSKFGDGIEGWDSDNNDMFYAEANKKYDSLVNYKTENDSVNKRMIDTLQSNPEAAGLFRDIMKGAPMEVAIARNVDIESIKPLDGDPNFDDWNKAREERESKLKEKDKYISDLETNVKASADVVKAFATENNLEAETTIKFMDQVETMVGELYNGKVTPSLLNTLYRAFNADVEVKDAVEKAVVDVKNEKIEAVKEADSTSKKGDGVPNLNATNKEIESEVKSDRWASAVDKTMNRRNRFK